jgi:hypothetical protein
MPHSLGSVTLPYVIIDDVNGRLPVHDRHPWRYPVFVRQEIEGGVDPPQLTSMSLGEVSDGFEISAADDFEVPRISEGDDASACQIPEGSAHGFKGGADIGGNTGPAHR